MGNAQANLEIPSKMKRTVLVEGNPDMKQVKVEIQKVDVPVPKSGEVLIRVAAAVLNPSDYGEFLRSSAAKDDSKKTKQPKPIGKEGSGVVVAAGGFLGRRLIGSNVGFVGLKRQGSHSEYVVADAMKCFQLPSDVPVEDAASFFVNPYTVVGILDTARSFGSPGLVHTAAASSLGKMMVKLCLKQKFPLINVVRRKEQADMLRKLGAEHVVVTSKDDDSWKKELKLKIDTLNITVAFDAVAGKMSGDLLTLLPDGGGVYVYGALAQQAVGAINPLDIIYRKKKVRGWLLTYWLQSGGTVSMMNRLRWASPLVNSGLKDGWSSTKFQDVSMDNMWNTFLDMYTKSGFTDRKLRVRIGRSSTGIPAVVGETAASKGWKSAVSTSPDTASPPSASGTKEADAPTKEEEEEEKCEAAPTTAGP
eukprot:g185.t1